MSVTYILVGLAVGFLSGIFGIGGSIITTPILKLFFGIPEFIALASPLPVTIPTAISGVYGYWRKGITHKKTALFAIMGGLPATIVGALLTKVINSKWLMLLTGILVVLIGISFFRNNKHKIPECIKNCHENLKALLIGIVAGLFSGLLAVGGGFILVPAFVIILGLSMQEAAATSLLCVACYAIPGTIVHWQLNHIDWNLVLNLSIGVIPSSYLGAHVASFAKSKLLQRIFSLILIIFGVYFIFKLF